MIIDVTMTLDEKIERMTHLVAQDEFMPNCSLEHKQDALELISSIKNQVNELNLRSLIQTVTIRKANEEDNWRELAIYILTNN
jgi:hypothetical protein